MAWYNTSNSLSTAAIRAQSRKKNYTIRTTDAIYTGEGGTLNITLEGDADNTIFYGISAGSFIPFRVKFVSSSPSGSKALWGGR